MQNCSSRTEFTCGPLLSSIEWKHMTTSAKNSVKTLSHDGENVDAKAMQLQCNWIAIAMQLRSKSKSIHKSKSKSLYGVRKESSRGNQNGSARQVRTRNPMRRAIHEAFNRARNTFGFLLENENAL